MMLKAVGIDAQSRFAEWMSKALWWYLRRRSRPALTA